MAKGETVHDDEVTGKIFDRVLYRRLWPFARPYRRWLLISTGLLFALSLLNLAQPLLLRSAIDDWLAPDDALEQAERVTGLGRTALLMLAAGIGIFICRYAQMWIANVNGQRIIRDIRLKVFRHTHQRSLRFFDKNPVGKLVTRVTSDVEALAELFTAGVDVIAYDIVMIGLILGALFWIHPLLALFTLALLPVMGLWSFLFKREAQALFRDVRSQVSRLNSYINECVTGIRVVQIFRAERRTEERFHEWNDDLRRSHMGTVRNFSFFFPGIEVFSSLATATILIAGHHYVTGGTLSVGDMMAFWFLLQRFFEPLRQISEKYNVLQSAIASAERVFNLLDDDRSVPEAAHPKPLMLTDGTASIRFEDVHFSYDGEVEVLKGVSFDVKPGEKLAIVGATGAGKSSVINVLARFYDITGGRVLVGDQDIREVSKTELRRSVGVVLQDVFLFADTVRENLRLGDTSIEDEKLREACRTVFAENFVNRLENGLDHEVQERGATFSLGEKQLLAFARTIVADPPILVLDEATANIDTETERLIQRALDRLMEKRTVIVIAHRLSTIEKADRILVMHHGEIRESGTHQELLKADGLYRRLYELQFEGQRKRESA